GAVVGGAAIAGRARGGAAVDGAAAAAAGPARATGATGATRRGPAGAGTAEAIAAAGATTAIGIAVVGGVVADVADRHRADRAFQPADRQRRRGVERVAQAGRRGGAIVGGGRAPAVRGEIAEVVAL